MRVAALILLVCTGLAACSRPAKPVKKETPENKTQVQKTAGPSAEDRARVVARAEASAKGLSDKLLASQVVMAGIDGNGKMSAYMQNLLKDAPPGAVMLFKANLDTNTDTVKQFLSSIFSLISSTGAPRPFIALDLEGGDVRRLRKGVADLPAPGTYSDAGLVGSDAEKVAGKIALLGFNMNMAPVAEMESSLNRAFLGSRSYGSDPVFVEEACRAFIRAMAVHKVLCVAKHFPGEGPGDPHAEPVVLNGSRQELDTGLAPLESLIKDGTVKALMVSHALVPAWDKKRIASLSPVVINNWLRGELGFKGLLLADDFSMAAAASETPPLDACVDALAAGVDMVMAWPKDIVPLHKKILAALRQGKLTHARLEEAATRIITLKLEYGLTN